MTQRQNCWWRSISVMALSQTSQQFCTAWCSVKFVDGACGHASNSNLRAVYRIAGWIFIGRKLLLSYF
jgi:hypothetical protein